MTTPPVGINLYVVQGLRKRGRIDDVIIGAARTDSAPTSPSGQKQSSNRLAVDSRTRRH